MQSQWLGRVDYLASLDLQAQAIQAEKETVFGLEYAPTITLGRRASAAVDLKAAPDGLAQRGVQVVVAERGGQATLHNPGQLVIYPVLNLRAHSLGVRDYLCVLQKTTRHLLADLGVPVETQGDQPGLYTAAGKLVFFGVRIQKGWASHGLSLNVHNDLSEFGLIRSCGKATETFARLADHGISLSLERLFTLWVEHFRAALDEIRRTADLGTATVCLTPTVNPPMLEKPFELRI